MNIFVLFGQTATGKTAKALELANQHNGEIVNFDSRQIYKKLTLVTGKDVTPEMKFIEQKTVNRATIGYYQDSTRIWLYDIVDPKEIFSSSEYSDAAFGVIVDILSRGKTPILVGGTGYYLYHLLYGVPQISVPENWPLRNELKDKSVSELTELLKAKNASLFDGLNESDRMNPRRLIRRIEIAYAGVTLPTRPTEMSIISRLNSLKSHPGGGHGPIDIQFMPFFHTESEKTREIIRARVMKRLEEGAVEETQKLLSEGYKKTDPGLNAIGYQQIIAYIENEMTKDQMIELWITREIQYAKRQKTFFKKYFVV